MRWKREGVRTANRSTILRTRLRSLPVEMRRFVEQRDAGVVEHALHRKDAVQTPLFRQIDQPSGHRAGGFSEGQGAAQETHLAAVGGAIPEDTLHQLAAPRADESGEAQNLAPAQVEGHVPKTRAGQSPDLKQDLARLGGGLIMLLDQHLLPGHQRQQPGFVELGDGEMADRTAITKHRDLVTDFEDFLGFVRDEDDSLALVAKPSDDFEKPFDLGDGQRGGRLVENEHIEFAMGTGTGDHQQLLIGNRHLAHLLPGMGSNAEAFELRARSPIQLRGMHDGAFEPRLIEWHEKVLGDREMGKKADLLWHVADAPEQGRILGRIASEDANAALGRPIRCRSGS